MSSDSEDFDEDELLQMALKEQAQRDVNYKRPSTSSKPVVNLLQPPPPPSSVKEQGRSNPNAKNRPHSQKNSLPRATDDDEDSEVELLSISSGDEDSSKDQSLAAKNRPHRKGSKDAAADQGWDGTEPDCWKRVDEAELGRRVREMRETRSVLVPLNFDKRKPAAGLKGITHIQSLTRGMECIDPLGLGIIDSRSLRLITDASDSSPAISQDKLDSLDSSTREKLNFYSDIFEPKLFLSRVHHQTSAADLESGALALKTDLRGRTQQKKQLVKENFDCFISCKTTIDDIESKLNRIEQDPEGAGTKHLFNAIQNVTSIATRALEPLLERQAQAEKIRSVQGMLQRFRTLFNLPSAIRGSISKGEYDLAVREYRKAKSIGLPSHVGILKRVVEEVEKVMQEFRAMLYKSMEDPQIELAELENTVRLLLELEPESDPVWHYLNIQNRRIRGLLERCTSEHEARMEALHNDLRERVLSNARWRQMQQDSNKSSDVDISVLMGESPGPVDAQLVDLSGEEVDALRERYIRKLTAVLIHHLPAFWRLALSVFSGKFAKASQVASGNTLPDPDTNAKSNPNKVEDKVNDVKYSSHSLDEVADMVQSTVSLYEIKVHNTFRDLEESNILCPFMSNAIKEISKPCQAIEGKEAGPPNAVRTLRMLHSEVTKIYILRLCSWMRATTEEISKDDLWTAVSVLERDISPYTISFLPLAFRAMTSSAMDQISGMIQDLKSEAAKSDDMFEQVQEIQLSIRLAFINCLLDFAGYLGRIASDLSQSRSTKEGGSQLQNGYIHEAEGNGLLSISDTSDSHQKLLIILSNIGYCKDKLSYELYNKFKHIWSQSREREEVDPDIQDLVLSFEALEEKILEQYTRAKANLIRTSAVNYLLDAGVQWSGAPIIKGVRDAAVELILTLVAAHAEVFAGAKPMLEKTLGILVEGLIDTLLSLFQEKKDKEIKSLDANGFCQLMLELEYFETVLNSYFTPEAYEALKALQAALLEKATESASETVENPGHHNRRPTRGSEDGIPDERQQGMTVSPDDLIALAQQYSSELLQAELERTRLNVACFIEPLDPVPESVKFAYSFRGSLDSPKNSRGRQAVGSPGFSRQRRR
ncbi:exocyst complex component SEC5A-like [Aristolochia californica]|uniref:exocyst complex component SEC5A-like n=1 Tax=Aristolochia californica TaxID=171875 RepID=UPI0035E31722